MALIKMLHVFSRNNINFFIPLGIKRCQIGDLVAADSVALESHQALRRHGLRVLENLCLDAVDAGDYELIALPLKLMDCEASPVRAVLRPWP